MTYSHQIIVISKPAMDFADIIKADNPGRFS